MFIERMKSGAAVFMQYLVYVYVAIFPFFIFKSFLYQGSSSRFVLTALLGGLLAIVFGVQALWKHQKVRVLITPLSIILGVYLLFLFVSAFLGADFAMSFWSRAERTSGLFYLTHLVPFLLALISLLSEQKTRNTIITILLSSTALYSLCSLLGPQGFKVLFLQVPYDGFLFGNSSFAAMYLFAVFLLSLYVVFRKKRTRKEWYWFILPFVFVLNPFLLNMKLFTGGIAHFSDILGAAQATSIGVYISILFLIGFFILFLIRSRKVRTWCIIGLLGVVVVVTSVGVHSLLSDNGVVRQAYNTKSTAARPLVWELSRSMIAERPVTGWGIDNFSKAFQTHFDTRLMQADYGNEPWFDRAHTVILDQTIDTGYVGVSLYVAIYLVLLILLAYVLIHAVEREDRVLGSILVTYFIVHFLELQTAFDTTISMTIGIVMMALTFVLYEKVRAARGASDMKTLPVYITRGVGVLFIGYFGWAVLFGTIPFWRVQHVNGVIRTVGNAEKRIPLYPIIFSTPVDPLGIIWRTTNDFEKGISESPSILADQKRAADLVKELDVFTKAYESYIEKYPNNFRAHINLANMYVYHMLFGINMLDKVGPVLDRAQEIAPLYPQPYWIKSVAALYSRDFEKARFYAQKASEMNPDVVETKRLQEYIETSIRTFPEIDLYSFNQI